MRIGSFHFIIVPFSDRDCRVCLPRYGWCSICFSDKLKIIFRRRYKAAEILNIEEEIKEMLAEVTGGS